MTANWIKFLIFLCSDELGHFVANKHCLRSLKMEGCSNLGGKYAYMLIEKTTLASQNTHTHTGLILGQQQQELNLNTQTKSYCFCYAMLCYPVILVIILSVSAIKRDPCIQLLKAYFGIFLPFC